MEKTKAEIGSPEWKTKQDKFDRIFSMVFISILIMGFTFTIGFLIGSNREDKILYPEFGKVIDVDWATDTVTIETSSGFRYQLHGCEDWEVGDYCSMIMQPRGTDLIYDDLILKAYYEVIE